MMVRHQSASGYTFIKIIVVVALIVIVITVARMFVKVRKDGWVTGLLAVLGAYDCLKL